MGIGGRQPISASAAEFSDKAPARKIQEARPLAARGHLAQAVGARSPLFTGKRRGAALARTEPRIGPAPTRQAPLLPSCRPSPMPVKDGDRGGGRGSLKSRRSIFLRACGAENSCGEASPQVERFQQSARLSPLTTGKRPGDRPCAHWTAHRSPGLWVALRSCCRSGCPICPWKAGTVMRSILTKRLRREFS